MLLSMVNKSSRGYLPACTIQWTRPLAHTIIRCFESFMKPSSVSSTATSSSTAAPKAKSLSERIQYTKKETKETEEPKLKFKGFIAGSAFQTKKGYKGQKIDSLWNRQLIEAFDLDDPELVKVALESPAADKDATVEGGEFGSPYSIGGYGLYAESQFQGHFNSLKENEEALAKGIYHLSMDEWETVDRGLNKLAHYGRARFPKLVQGDGYAALAVRKRAFIACKVLLEMGVDPLVTNAEGDDVFELLKMIYGEMSQDLRDIDKFRMDFKSGIGIPSEVLEMEAREEAIRKHYEDLLPLIDTHTNLLKERLVQVGMYKYEKRKLELRHQCVPKYILWNVSLEEKIQGHLDHTDWLVTHIKEKILMVDKLEHEKDKSLTSILDSQKKALFEIENVINEAKNKDYTVDECTELQGRKDSAMKAQDPVADESLSVKIALGLEKDPNKTAKRDLFARKSSDPKIPLGVLGEEKWESTTYYV